MKQHGYSLVEMVVVVGIILVLAAVAAPNLRAYSVEAHALGAGRQFKEQFLKARSIAVMRNRHVAIRFETEGDDVFYSVYADGGCANGVLSADIRKGIDIRIAGPFRLTGGAPGVRVGINPGVKAIPPDRGVLDPTDPIRFGRSNMLSFSPLGTATPGTFYLAGETIQAAVRVNPGSARVRLMVYRGGRWVER